ncbi:hypothetical protein Ciccas_000596 [Cichlidogyrus casuarinus]|uniref:SUZ domain-containing protein n=1 Tax=Cichlidogyrus casuarinus TaxID=1844966 RepID=A0ABD2QMW3_9PLAT
MESAPKNIVILKRPNNSAGDAKKSDTGVKTAPTSKTLEEKQANYEAARRRILGSDVEEYSDSNKASSDDSDLGKYGNGESPPPTNEPSPNKDANLKYSLSNLAQKIVCIKRDTRLNPTQKINGTNPPKQEVMPLMSIEFGNPRGNDFLDNAMEKMTLRGDEGCLRKNALFRLEPTLNEMHLMQTQQQFAADAIHHGIPGYTHPMRSHHYASAPMPQNFTIRQHVNTSLIHPYANSNVNHVRAHQYPSYAVAQHQIRYNPPPNMPFQANQPNYNFVPQSSFNVNLNVPPPGYYPTGNVHVPPMPTYPQPSCNISNGHTQNQVRRNGPLRQNGKLQSRGKSDVNFQA